MWSLERHRPVALPEMTQLCAELHVRGMGLFGTTIAKEREIRLIPFKPIITPDGRALAV
jgi:hypothetical protein